MAVVPGLRNHGLLQDIANGRYAWCDTYTTRIALQILTMDPNGEDFEFFLGSLALGDSGRKRFAIRALARIPEGRGVVRSYLAEHASELDEGVARTLDTAIHDAELAGDSDLMLDLLESDSEATVMRTVMGVSSSPTDTPDPRILEQLGALAHEDSERFPGARSFSERDVSSLAVEALSNMGADGNRVLADIAASPNYPLHVRILALSVLPELDPDGFLLALRLMRECVEVGDLVRAALVCLKDEGLQGAVVEGLVAWLRVHPDLSDELAADLRDRRAASAPWLAEALGLTN